MRRPSMPNEPYIDDELQDILNDLEESGKDKPKPEPKPEPKPKSKSKSEPEQKSEPEPEREKEPENRGPTLVAKRTVEASIVQEDEEEEEEGFDDPAIIAMRDKALGIAETIVTECDEDRKQANEVIEMFIDMVRDGGEEDGRPSKSAVDGLASALNTKIQNSSVKSRAVDSLTKLITATKKKNPTSIKEQNNFVSDKSLKELLDGKKNK